MSVYVEEETAFTDLDMLQEAIREAGLGSQIVLAPDGDGVYRMWSHENRMVHNNSSGEVRGRDASLIIAGGLDTWTPGPGSLDRMCPWRDSQGLRGGPGWYCGDTAFVLDRETGRYVAKIDIAHGNAPQNWTNIKDNYAVLKAESLAQAHGLRYERARNEQGQIVLRVYPKEGARMMRQTVLAGRQ